MILGIIIGLLLAILWILTIRSLPTHIQNLPQRVIFKRKGAIIDPPSDRELHNQEVLERNNAQGKDTSLDELL